MLPRLRSIRFTREGRAPPVRAWVLVLLLLGISGPLAAQDSRTPDSAEPTLELSAEQARIGERFREFEEIAERMADLLRKADPERSALMRQVYAKAKKDLITTQIESVARRLGLGELAPAVKDQEAVLADLESLLELLLSEDRGQRLREQRERLENAAKEARRLLRDQKELRDRTEAGPESRLGAERNSETEGRPAEEEGQPEPAVAELTEKQAKLAGETKGLADTLDPRAAEQGETPENETDSQNSDKPTPSEERPAPGADKEPSTGTEGAAAAEPEAGQAAPGQKAVARSAKAMRDAANRIEAGRREEAGEDQSEAIASLEQALAELEEELRQLRDEERLDRLASLETRCRKMLEIQELVRDGTYRLDQVPVADRTRDHRRQAIELAGREQGLVVEVEQALIILEEDGTAAAFPEAFSQIRGDALAVSRLLEASETGVATLGLEEDIIATLEEMIAAFKRELRASRKEKSSGPDGGGGPEGNPPLVERVGELKLIRSLQFRVNERTERIRQSPPAPESHEAQRQLADLAVRQGRIQAITEELARESKP